MTRTYSAPAIPGQDAAKDEPLKITEFFRDRFYKPVKSNEIDVCTFVKSLELSKSLSTV